MPAFTIDDASINLSDLIERAAAGEEVVILRGKTPVAQLVAVPPRTASQRRFGAYRGEFEVPEAFFEPLPEDELRAFEGE